ncbi:MAG: hypothetical protein COS68_05320 [Elusimicrobia bacterium CG06_land_8_20_14_3_00_38_11]|nr:MAG: hypothetical protein COS68_05320 [Elusimicrobia bacterium CG06_land_8_20_14_3_00_38_11]
MAVIGGIVAVLIGIVLLFGGPLFGLPVYMWDDFLVCLKGTISSGLVLGGILAVIAGVSAIKDRAKAKSEENK